MMCESVHCYHSIKAIKRISVMEWEVAIELISKQGYRCIKMHIKHKRVTIKQAIIFIVVTEQLQVIVEAIIINSKQLVLVIKRCIMVATIILILHRSITTRFKELVSHQVISIDIHIIIHQELTIALRHKYHLIIGMDKLIEQHCCFQVGIMITVVVMYFILHGNVQLKLRIV